MNLLNKAITVIKKVASVADDVAEVALPQAAPALKTVDNLVNNKEGVNLREQVKNLVLAGEHHLLSIHDWSDLTPEENKLADEAIEKLTALLLSYAMRKVNL